MQLERRHCARSSDQSARQIVEQTMSKARVSDADDEGGKADCQADFYLTTENQKRGKHQAAIDIGQLFVHVDPMHAVTYSYARENLKAVLDKAVNDRAPIAIARQRGEGAVVISESEWNSMEETLHLLSSPENARQLVEAIAQLDAGKGVERELIRP